MKNVTLVIITVVMILGTVVNVGCGFLVDDSCDSFNLRTVEPGTYEVQNLSNDPNSDRLLFGGCPPGPTRPVLRWLGDHHRLRI